MQQDHSETVYLRQGESAVRIRSPDLVDFHNLTGTFLTKDTSVVMKIWGPIFKKS